MQQNKEPNKSFWGIEIRNITETVICKIEHCAAFMCMKYTMILIKAVTVI